MSALCLHLSHAPDAADGGIAIAVADLLAAQRDLGLKVAWVTANSWPAWRRDACLYRAVRGASPQLAHLHGLWRSQTRIAPLLACSAVPLVVAPHGMLDPWALAQSRRKKRLVRLLWEDRVLRTARCLQALCRPEAEAIRALGFRTPIALIPNGVAIPDRSAPLPPAPWNGRVPDGERVLLFLGRFHHKKGIDPLLAAWASLEPAARRQGWWLVLAGYGDQGALARRVSAERLARCSVLGPCFGLEKAACLAQASAFVLPSFSEGLPMAALEAMSWGLPCLLSEACNLPEAFEAGAALPLDPRADAIARGLQQLFSLADHDRETIGSNGRFLMAERFSWARIAAQTAQLYRWLLGGGQAPGFVTHPRPSSGGSRG